MIGGGGERYIYRWEEVTGRGRHTECVRKREIEGVVYIQGTG